jgi:hypothetical protein
VIALRGMGRFLVERLAETDTTKSSRFLAGKR